MRLLLPCVTLLLVSACAAPETSAPAGGVGFQNYSEYQRRQAAAAEARYYSPNPVQTVQGPLQNPAVPFPSAQTGAPTAAELAQAGVGGATALAQTQAAAAQQTAPLAQTTAALPASVPSAAPAVDNTGISDEQEFSAVASRETIESDKERIQQNKAQYQQIEPGALPARAGSNNAAAIVEYAIKAPNRLGEAIYGRSSLALSNHNRACGRYTTPEEAQAAFLKSGGAAARPQKPRSRW